MPMDEVHVTLTSAQAASSAALSHKLALWLMQERSAALEAVPR